MKGYAVNLRKQRVFMLALHALVVFPLAICEPQTKTINLNTKHSF